MKTIIMMMMAGVMIIAVKKGVSLVDDRIQVMNAPAMPEISGGQPVDGARRLVHAHRDYHQDTFTKK